MSYKIGSREQLTFLPSCIEDYVSQEHPVRIYDAFVEALDIDKLGISIEHNRPGEKPYNPKEMLKLFIYGYSYGIKGSRKLERATYDNLAFIWLMGNLHPDYRTIARFREKNSEAIERIIKQCGHICLKLGLIDGNDLFTDSTNVRANASRKNNWTKDRCEKVLKKLEEDINKYLSEFEETDRAESGQDSFVKTNKDIPKEKVKLREQIQNILNELETSKKKKINTTEREAITVKTRNGTHPCYQIQATVDGKNGLIIATKTTSEYNDKNQLNNQIERAIQVTVKKPKRVIADSGYHSLSDLKKLKDKGIEEIIVPSQLQAHKGKVEDPFSKDKFIYDQKNDEYICPVGNRLSNKGLSEDRIKYRTDGKSCIACKHYGICTKGKKGREINRHIYEEFQEELRQRYSSEEGQQIYKLRKERSELPFAHIKHNMGLKQLISRGKEKVNAEFSLYALGYNLTRMITIMGATSLVAALSKL